MKKRILSVLLSVCLLLPLLAVADIQPVSAETSADYIIKELPAFQANVTATLSAGGSLWTSPNVKFDAVDLTKYGYDKDPANVGFQMDTFVTGDALFMEYMNSGYLGGQMEITSSGVPDKNEAMAWPNNLSFGEGEWIRITIPFSKYSGTDFKPNNFNFTRMYLNGPEPHAPSKYFGATGTFKIANLCIVDLRVPEEERPTTEEMPLGDGTFEPEVPVWKEVEFTAGYDDSVKYVAGYNLAEYVAEHESQLREKGFDGSDYTAVVNSLLEGLSVAGGGTLFIPAGHYPFYGEIRVPAGISIVGEWSNPDENPEIRGTVLEVYGGRGSVDGAAFINMGGSSKVSNLSVWYPEQSVENVAQYPPSFSTNGYAVVQKVTLVNSYFGIQNVNTCNSPNAWDVYGTPLNIGIDFDNVIDIHRIQNIHFAAKYWERSGLPNAPTTAEQKQLLEEQLYNYAIGITVRRIDWSYVGFSDIKGYNIGLFFDLSVGGGYPNGQCMSMTFTDCKYAVFAYGISGCSEMLSDFVIKNCEYGIYTDEDADGILQMVNMEISATKEAIHQGGKVRMSIVNSTIRGGKVVLEGGNNIFMNNEFLTLAPHITMDSGTVSAIVVGNTDSFGDEIEYDNKASCALSYSAEKADIATYTPVTREELFKDEDYGPKGDTVLLPQDIDTTGMTDVTEKLQGYLTELGNQGGGTLYLIPGIYRIEGTLSVPEGVELRGSLDVGAQPTAKNTIFMVYTPIEAGKDQYTSTATLTMAKNSGIRGVIFNYPEQNATYTKEVETVGEGDKAVTDDWYYFDFVQYPFLVRGAGENVYLINTTFRNAWNGVDFKTYRCDNHYISYLAGHCYNRGVVVGNGTTGGVIRDIQFNYNSILGAPGKWAGFGGFENTGEISSGFHQQMQAQFNNNAIVIQLGDVNDQIVYDCFNYAGYIGTHLVEENGEAANVRLFGRGVDYNTVGTKVEAAENVEFLSYQACAFNQAGSNGSTGRWAVDQSVNPIYDIWVTDSFEGKLSLVNMVEWGPSANAAIRVDNGELVVTNATIMHDNTKRFEMNGDGILTMFALQLGGNWTGELATENQDQLFIKGGCYTIAPPEQQNMGAFDWMYLNRTRWSVPNNVTFADGAELMATEAFDGYEFTKTSDYRVYDATTVTERRGEVRLRMKDSQFMQGVLSGQNAKEKPAFELTSGNAKDLYRIEWRLKVDSMRATEDSEITLSVSTIDRNVCSEEVFTITKDGAVYLKDGTKLGTVEFGTYYRFAVEYDARNKNQKTMTVYLLNDSNGVIGKSAAAVMSDAFQGENNLSGFLLSSIAETDTAPDTETDFTLDYFYALRSAESTIAAGAVGDVDGNGKIDSTDARLVLQYAVKKIAALPNANVADVDGNGKIDSTDARLILQYAVKKISKFPAA
ncbi:MAG: hypothetical protein E7549_00935 [Ruminococcaceae bacterium]|nr:hypothetical protein [Oscillospiraceae bacterium]